MASLSAIDQILITYAGGGNLQEVRNLLRAGANVNVQYTTDGGATALYMASQNSHEEVIKALLTIDKVDVNHQDVDGVTALPLAGELKW
jgi:Ankyrin repeats (3 copies)